ncbi:MAG: hypothetical protein ACRDT4_04215 [Micromonosporaceae bacterium]
MGVPLTLAEKAEVDRREGLRRHVPGLRKALHALGDSEPDIVIDHLRGGVLRVRTRQPAARVKAALAESGVRAGDVVVQWATYELKELLGYQRAIRKGWSSGSGWGADIAATGIDHDRQLLRIEVNGDRENAIRDVSSVVPRGAFEVVAGGVQPGRSPYDKDPSPFHGGYAIQTGSIGCTLGFPAYSPGPKYWWMSAGHCGSVGERFCQPSCSVSHWSGTVARNSMNSSDLTPLADALAVGTLAQYTHSNLFGGARMTSREGWSADSVGQIDCVFGVRSGSRCGHLTNKSYDVNYRTQFGHRYFYSMRKVDFKTSCGDSGGPHYYNGRIHGLNAGYASSTVCAEAYGFYSHIDDVLVSLGMTDIDFSW